MAGAVPEAPKSSPRWLPLAPHAFLVAQVVGVVGLCRADKDYKCRGNTGNIRIPRCQLTDLRAGMVLREEIRTHTGLLVAAKGQEITSALLLRVRNFRERNQISGKVTVVIPKNSGLTFS